MCLCSCTPCEGIHAQVTSQGGGGYAESYILYYRDYTGILLVKIPTLSRLSDANSESSRQEVYAKGQEVLEFRVRPMEA